MISKTTFNPVNRMQWMGVDSSRSVWILRPQRKENFMHLHNRQMGRWSTSAFGERPGPSQEELAELAKHVKQCRGARGRMYFLRSAA